MAFKSSHNLSSFSPQSVTLPLYFIFCYCTPCSLPVRGTGLLFLEYASYASALRHLHWWSFYWNALLPGGCITWLLTLSLDLNVSFSENLACHLILNCLPSQHFISIFLPVFLRSTCHHLVCLIFYLFTVYFLWLECMFSEGRDFSPFCSLLKTHCHQVATQ